MTETECKSDVVVNRPAPAGVGLRDGESLVSANNYLLIHQPLIVVMTMTSVMEMVMAMIMLLMNAYRSLPPPELAVISSEKSSESISKMLENWDSSWRRRQREQEGLLPSGEVVLVTQVVLVVVSHWLRSPRAVIVAWPAKLVSVHLSGSWGGGGGGGGGGQVNLMVVMVVDDVVNNLWTAQVVVDGGRRGKHLRIVDGKSVVADVFTAFIGGGHGRELVLDVRRPQPLRGLEGIGGQAADVL